MQEFIVIGEKLRMLRTEKDESLEDVAKKIGLSKSLLSKYERGIVDPGLKALSRLVRYFDVSLDWLFGFTEDRKPINRDNPLSELNRDKQLEVIKYIEYLKSKE